MTKGILGKKIGMTQVFAENGDLIPVTVVEVTPNVVLQKKSAENDGYEAINLDLTIEKNPVLTSRKQVMQQKLALALSATLKNSVMLMLRDTKLVRKSRLIFLQKVKL